MAANYSPLGRELPFRIAWRTSFTFLSLWWTLSALLWPRKCRMNWVKKKSNSKLIRLKFFYELTNCFLAIKRVVSFMLCLCNIFSSNYFNGRYINSNHKCHISLSYKLLIYNIHPSSLNDIKYILFKRFAINYNSVLKTV